MMETSGQNCSACGKPLTTGARFCKNCGKPVSQVPVSAPTPFSEPPNILQAPPPPPWEVDPLPETVGSSRPPPLSREDPPSVPPPKTSVSGLTAKKGLSLGGFGMTFLAILIGKLAFKGCSALVSGMGPGSSQAWQVCQKYSLDKVVKELNFKYGESGQVKIPGDPNKADWDEKAGRYRFEAIATLDTDQTHSHYEMPFVCTALQVDLSGAKVWKAEGVWFSPAVKK